MPRGDYGYSIKGNTAIKPLRKTTIRKPKKQSNERIKIKKQRMIKNEKKNDRKYMLTVVVFILGLGCITIASDSKVYKMQKAVSTLESQISTTKEENEALRVKILKYSSLSNIEENAKNNIGMHIPQGEDVVKIDFSNNYFEDVKTDTIVKTEDDGFLSSITKIFK